MKTIEQWIDTLPKELKESILRRQQLMRGDTLTNCLSQAVLLGFVWSLTDEDNEGEFWYSFYECVVWAEKLDENDRLRTKNSKK